MLDIYFLFCRLQFCKRKIYKWRFTRYIFI